MRRRLHDADDVGFENVHEHYEAQDFASEHGEAQNIFHISSRSFDFGCTGHTRSERPRLCPDCHCVFICCCRRGGRSPFHRRERIEWTALRGLADVFVSDVQLGSRLRGERHSRMRGVEHHPFRPFVVRTDAQMDLIAGTNCGIRMCRGTWKPPIGSKKRQEQEASHPHKVLPYRHRELTLGGLPTRR